MSGRLLITSAFTLLFTGPAFADCNQAIQDLNEKVTEAETGAATAGSAVPASPHQEQVLAGKQQGETGPTGQSAAGQSDMAASPHQQQVLAGGRPVRSYPISSPKQARWPRPVTSKDACRK
jgi:hypothetical protein